MKNNHLYSCLLVSLVVFLFSSCGLGSKTGINADVDKGYDLCLKLLDAPSTAVFLAYHPSAEIKPLFSKNTSEIVRLNEKSLVGCYEIEADNKYGGRGRHYFYILYYNGMLYAERFPYLQNYKNITSIEILKFLDNAAREMQVSQSEIYTQDESRLRRMTGF